MNAKAGERLYERAYGAILLDIAAADWESADALAATGRGRPETVVFLCQQAIEKSLKAVLCHHSTPVPLVHDLGALIAKMPSDLTPPYGYQLTRYNDYAGILRYERGHEKLELAERDSRVLNSYNPSRQA